MGFTPVIAKRLTGHVVNSAYPLINVDIDITLVLPANAKGTVPVLMMFGGSRLPAPVLPSRDEMEKINDALRKMLSERDPELKSILDKYPAYQPIASANNGFGFPPLKHN